VPEILVISETEQLVIEGADEVVAEQVVLQEILEVAEQGPPGPPGADGSVGGAYEHTQAVASDTWTVNHNLGYRPAASLLTVGGREMWAEVIHTSANQFIAYFDSPVTGVAICS
jgi:hypothetical protein